MRCTQTLRTARGELFLFVCQEYDDMGHDTLGFTWDWMFFVVGVTITIGAILNMGSRVGEVQEGTGPGSLDMCMAEDAESVVPTAVEESPTSPVRGHVAEAPSAIRDQDLFIASRSGSQMTEHASELSDRSQSPEAPPPTAPL